MLVRIVVKNADKTTQLSQTNEIVKIASLVSNDKPYRVFQFAQKVRNLIYNYIVFVQE